MPTPRLADLIVPGAVLGDVAAGNKRALLTALAQAAEVAYGVDAALVAARLAQREKLGSTGFGGGIALPHARIAGLDRVVGVFARLAKPIDFAAVDELPIDLAVMLLSPENAGSEHLRALALVSRALRDRAFTARLRGAASVDALHALLLGVEARDAA